MTTAPSVPAPRSVKDYIFAVLAKLFRVRQAFAPPSPRKLLIIQLQQVGDTVIFTPALRALRGRFPDSRIDILANKVSAQLYRASSRQDRIVLAEEWPPTLSLTGLRSLIAMVRSVRRERYDCVVTDITGQSFAYALLAFFSGAPIRVGFDLLNRGFLHNVRVPYDPALPYVRSNLAIAHALGAPESDPREEVVVRDADRAAVRDKLQSAGIGGGTPIAVVHPGSNWQSKTWFSDRWAGLADTLVERHRQCVVFVGTRSENAIVEAARAVMRNPSISLVGNTTLGELAALILHAEIFVGTDSGPRNIAGALGVPNVTVMSAQEDSSHWRGVRPGELIVRSDARCTGCCFAHCAHRLCMQAIDETSVATLVHVALSGGRAAPPRLTTLAVPERLYVEVAGTGDADCRALRRLAKRSPERRAARSPDGSNDGPSFAKV